MNIGNQRSAAGEAKRALGHYEESAAIAQSAQLAPEEAIALSNAARSAIVADRRAHAAELLARADRITARLQPTHEQAVLWLHLARSHQRIGDSENLLHAQRDL